MLRWSLYFRVDRKMVTVLLREVLYVEGLKDYVKIHLPAGPPLVVKQTSNGLEEKLPARNFLRVPRSFIVALDKVPTYSPGHLEVARAEVPIGRLYRGPVTEALK